MNLSDCFSIRFCSILAVSFVFFSCENANYQPEPLDDCQTDFPYSVSLSQAISVVGHFIQDKGVSMPTRGNELIVSDSFTIVDNDNLPIIHTINFDGGGFAIISGDKRVYPLLAYSFDGCIPSDESAYPSGLKFWLNEVRSGINYIRKNGNDTNSLSEIVWSRFENESFQTRSMPADSSYWEHLYDNSVGPLLTTTWNQTSPFNDYLPFVTATQHAYVGCVPIAIAQIMRYFEYPISYSWSQMPDNTANSYIYSLINDIWSCFGVGINITYDTSGTYVDSEYNLATYLKNEFGYSTATQINYSKHSDYSIVRNELIDYERPVILLGGSGSSGHAWVCDGAHEWEEDIVVNGKHNVYGYLYFHHVWGGDASYNGWYGFSNFVPTNSGCDYGSNMQLVYNIHP